MQSRSRCRTISSFAVVGMLIILVAGHAPPVAAQTLDIYFIDTEGGQATLYVSPSGESLLMDTGNPGPRDHERIMAAVRPAGLQRIDHVVTTHYHTDHQGGLEALSQALPIRNYYDHGPSHEAGRANVDAFMARYAEIAGTNRHTVKPGDRIPFAGVDVTVVTAHTAVLESPIPGAPGAGEANPFCASHTPRSTASLTDDDHSTGIVVAYGAFRTINLGDFTWNRELDLVCPNNPIGTIDVYQTPYHGMDRAGGPALVHGLRPRVAIMNNGPRKGGSADALQIMRTSPRLQDIWQLHWSYAAGVEHNAPGVFIANLDAPPVLASVIDPPPADPAGAGGAGAAGAPAAATPDDHTPAHSIKVSAQADGTFTVTNGRNGFSRTYPAED